MHPVTQRRLALSLQASMNKHLTFGSFNLAFAMIVNYRDVQTGYNNDLREIARQMIEKGVSNYAKSRLDVYPQTLMRQHDIRAFIGVI